MLITSEITLVVCIGNHASETLKTAAEELSFFATKSTGSRVKIENGFRMPKKGEVVFSLGNREKCEERGFAFENKFDDGFVSFIENGVLYICGKSDRGTLYGVYELLESVFGVRFLSVDATYVPDFCKSGVSVPDDYKKDENPTFSIRSYWTHDGEVSAAYSARKRIMTLWYDEVGAKKYGGGMRDIFYNDGHNINKLYQEGYFFEECKKEDGAEIYTGGEDQEGKPLILHANSVSDPSYSGNVCLSDERVEKYVTIGIIERIKKHKTCDYFGIMQEDTKFFCNCEKCRTAANKTDTVIGFCNKIARNVKRWEENEGAAYTQGRKKYIVTYAYGYTEIAPTIEVEDNIIIELALIDSVNYAYSLTDENQTDSSRKAIGGWRKAVPDNRLLFYSYETNFNNYHWYISNLKNLLPDLQYVQRFGKLLVTFEAGELFCNCWQALLRTYICSKLMWNPSRYTQTDVFSMAKEFCRLYYAQYGDLIFGYIEKMETAYDEIKKKYGKTASLPYHVASADHILQHDNRTEAIIDAFGVKHFLTANDPAYFRGEFLFARAEEIRGAYTAENGEMKKRLAGVLLTADIMYFTQWKYYNGISEDISYTDIAEKKDKYPEFSDFAKEIKEIVSLTDDAEGNVKKSLNAILGADDYAGMDGSRKFDFWKE